jgi:uncharacterized protein YqgC (DUF456 family)
MEIVWISLGFLFLILGILGAFLPVLPGPILSALGIWIFQLTDSLGFKTSTLWIATFLAVCITIADYIIPVYLTKRSKSHPYATRGATLGIVAGLFLFPPLGIIIMPIVGAILGELIAGSSFNKGLKSGFSAFLGFLAGTLLKAIFSFWTLGISIVKLF